MLGGEAWQQGEGVRPAVLQDLSALAVLCVGTAACRLPLDTWEWDNLRADGCAQDEPSRLMTWAVLSAFLLMAAAPVPVSEIGQIFILCAAPARFSQS